MQNLNRRRFILAAAASSTLVGLTACESWTWRPPEKGPLSAFLPEGADSGVEGAYKALLRMRDRLGIPVEIQQAVGRPGLEEALRHMAASSSTMVLAYGSEAGTVLQRIAADYPAQRFSLIQADAAAPVSCYKVLHEQSAWLAGTAAGLLSRTKIVGHIGELRSETALASRAAFYSGLRAALPQAKLLSSFVEPGNLGRIARAQIAAGADLVFHTLETDDAPVLAVARESRVPLIGRGRDWLAQTPEIYAMAAIADPGVAVFQAGQDFYDGLWKPGTQRGIGLENAEAVRLKLSERTSAAVQQRVGLFQRELKAGNYKIAPRYDGAEFKA
jgi:basic membrane protein A and related proteins